MTQQEKDALITYLDGQLMVLCRTLRPHIDPDAVGTLFESTYDILHDLQETIIPTVNLPQLVDKRNKK